MAEKKVKLERTYIVPLRRGTVKIQRYLRAKKAISVLRKFMKRHMKSDDIKIGHELNELIWERGGKYVPNKVNVLAIKEDNIVHVNLVGVKPEKEEEKKTEAKTEKKAEEKTEKKAEEKHEHHHEKKEGE
jgi:large subunit ribosomal protein L31e